VERGVERLAAGRTAGDAGLDLDVLLVRLVESLAGFADRDADGVVGLLDVTDQPGGFHRDFVVAHTRSEGTQGFLSCGLAVGEN